MKLLPTMELATLISTISRRYIGIVQVNAWGETSLFYNPDGLLKRGTYFVTFKEKDGENDAASALNRAEVQYRMNFKIGKDTYLSRFNEPSLPTRPGKGKFIAHVSGRDYNPMVLDDLIPHPVYGWMGWVSIINPSERSVNEILESGLLDESYNHAVTGYNKIVKRSENSGKSKRKIGKVDDSSIGNRDMTSTRKRKLFTPGEDEIETTEVAVDTARINSDTNNSEPLRRKYGLLLSDDLSDTLEDLPLTRQDFPDNYINFAHPQDYAILNYPIQKEMIYHHRDGRHARLLFRVSLQLDSKRFIPMTFVCDTGTTSHFLFGSKALQVFKDEAILKHDPDLDQKYLVVFGRKAPVNPTPEKHDPANLIGLRMLLRFGLILFNSPVEGFTFNVSFPYLTATDLSKIITVQSQPEKDEEL